MFNSQSQRGLSFQDLVRAYSSQGKCEGEISNAYCNIVSPVDHLESVFILQTPSSVDSVVTFWCGVSYVLTDIMLQIINSISLISLLYFFFYSG